MALQPFGHRTHRILDPIPIRSTQPSPFPGSAWNVSNDTFSLSIPEGLITITVTLQQDASGQTEPITGTFTPLASVMSPGSMDLSAPLHIDAGIVGSSDVVLPLSTSATITTPTGSFTGLALDANGNITLVGQANAVGGPLDTDLVNDVLSLHT